MHAIRDMEPSLSVKNGLTFGVTGQTAMMSDLSERNEDPWCLTWRWWSGWHSCC